MIPFGLSALTFYLVVMISCAVTQVLLGVVFRKRTAKSGGLQTLMTMNLVVGWLVPPYTIFISTPVLFALHTVLFTAVILVQLRILTKVITEEKKQGGN